MTELLSKHYRSGTPFPQAFAAFIAELFSEEELLFIDPNFSNIKQLAANIFSTSLEKYREISTTLIEQKNYLENSGFEAPVHIREHSPLFFYHLEEKPNERFRLEKDLSSDKWKLVGSEQSVSVNEIRNEQHELVLFQYAVFYRSRGPLHVGSAWDNP